MKQKTIWTNFLITGISVFPFIFNSCATDVDYLVRADFIFINETSYDITYDGDDGSIFSVKANDTTVYTIEGDGSKSVNKDSFNSPLQCYPCIRFDNIRCDTIEGGAGDIKNFVSKQVSARHMEYTYRYMEKHFQAAKECN